MKGRTAVAAILAACSTALTGAAGAQAVPAAPAGQVVSASPAAPAPAPAKCDGMRFSATSNALYLTAKRVYTLSSIAKACPKAPIKLTDANTKTWQLNSDLVLENGARLVLHGDGARGDVNTLRIRSNASNAANEVHALTARYGVIDADSVQVTSWDEGANAPDTNPNLPSGASKAMRGRAFVRALSFIDKAGVPRQSIMTINRSTFTNLGYYGPEAYGVTYKSQHCDRAKPAACKKAGVTGWQRNSRFIGNFMGTYYWGAQGIKFQGNQYSRNFMYGLNGHDSAANIVITGNESDNNANHGIICSQRCDNLTITGNRVHHNGMAPWRGPDPSHESEAAGQVHGIMLHRGVTRAVVANNDIQEAPNGAGIAVFDTAGAVFRNNKINGALFGIRITVGAGRNRFEGNQINASKRHAVYTFTGRDQPMYAKTGRPTGNVFVKNVMDGGGSGMINLVDSDGFMFQGNTIRNGKGPITLTTSANNTFAGNAFAPGQAFTLRGTAARRTSAKITPSKGIKVSADQFSKVTTR